MLDYHFGYCLKILALHYCAGRIVGEGHDNHLGLICDCLLKLCCRKSELILILKVDNNRIGVG